MPILLRLVPDDEFVIGRELDVLTLSTTLKIPDDPTHSVSYLASMSGCGFLGRRVGVCLDCLKRYRLLAGHSDLFFEPQTMKTKAVDLLIAIGLLQLVSNAVSTLALASPTGDDCRRKICNSAVSGCMRSDQTLNPLAWTEADKKTYCAAFFNGCMTREITPDVPWYSPEMDARFLRCPP